jgi:hypothetical protein
MLNVMFRVCVFSLAAVGLLGACSQKTPAPQKTNSEMDTAPASSPASRTAISVASSAFSEGGSIPQQFTCDGGDVSPTISWSGVPSNAKTLALIVEDPDAPGGTFGHWLVFNLSPDTNGLPEGGGSSKKLPVSGIEGTNDFNKVGYGGPCPPSGTHHYIFRVLALDDGLTLGSEATREDLLRAAQGHVVAEGKLTGTYSRK